jgi:hypothetical protein
VVGVELGLQRVGEHPAHLRMHDRLQIVERGAVGEDDAGELRPIELAVVAQDVVAEPANDGAQRLGAGANGVPRERVGVEHDGAVLRKHPGDGGLA